MPPTCSNCGQDFVIEPGFYFGAAYVSYGLGTAFFAAGFILNWLFWGIDLTVFATILVGGFLLLSPIILQLSRSFWIGFFVKKDPNA